MNKRGISAVVATVLIILITVSAVVFIWVGVVPMIRDSVGDASTTFENVGGGLEIVSNKGYTVYDPDSGKISVQVKRESGDSDIARIDFVFTIDGDSVVIGRTDILSPNEIKTYIFYDLLLTEFDSSDSIKIIVVYGGDTEGILVSEVTGVKAGTVIAVNCGDGKIDAGEECEIGNLNGNDCTTVPGGYDGGTLSCYGVGSAQECLFNVSLCTSLPVCGNLNIDAGEECDGTNLGSSDCTDYGYQAGTIGCYPEGVGAECTYDISPCYNITTTNIILSNLYENMVLYLPFDSNEGTSFNEKSLNGDLMDVIGSTIYWEADGKYNGGSYYFGGGTQPDPSSYNYIETGRNYIETFSGDFSVSLWIKLPLGWESTGFPSPFGMQNNNAANPSGSINLRLRHSGVRGVIFQYYAGELPRAEKYETLGYNLPLGPPNWIHIVVVGNSSTNGAGGLKVYVDGTFIPPGGNNDFGSTLDEDFSEWDATGRTLPIGHWNWGARDNHYTGNIDEFIIFNKTLNDTEVSEIYNNVYLIK